ncbi:hypothetical protein B0A48_15856 [Cryoendolithus antarcticus]|uniref:Uncharacterized protein n=1 Tax=Cryoendolithus antarcticus TaxID=1507870 RepID=A0A1V8SHM9_9PEZI|nr:hypothetical protein B0A48_15856 [Cryoendolithus antarcticus]
MPKVLEYTPAWLSRGEGSQAGFDLFKKESRGQKTGGDGDRSRRTIAHRGTEVFVAVGKDVRWAELRSLKDAHESNDGHQGNGHRILKTPAAFDITTLSVSPDGSLIAIVTAHTCHVGILPTSAHLRSGETTSLRLRAFQVGPTAHVLEQAPITTALWHPLSRPGVPSLLTVTKDACVRLWELDIENRHSFDEPSIAVDLKKLGNATSTATDLSASKYGARQGFSPDEVEMEVASACFGGSGAADEHAWSGMALWVAMTEGDVYALCPFLPSQFTLQESALPGLTTAVVAKTRALTSDAEATESEKKRADSQTKWLADLDEQGATTLIDDTTFERSDVYSRPTKFASIPKLQGPFRLSPEPDFGEITDIHVVAPLIDQSELYEEFGDEDEIENEGLSVSIVCLATNTGKVHICLDLDGVEAEWLPAKRGRSFALDDVDDDKDLLLFETIDLVAADVDTAHCAFTASPSDRYEVFVTSPTGVHTLDFNPWISGLEAELTYPHDEGSALRLENLLDSTSTLVDHPLALSSPPATSAIALLDSTLGFFLLTSNPSGPVAATLDLPHTPQNPYSPTLLALPAPTPREPYQLPAAFYNPSTLPQLLKSNPAALKQRLQFTPSTLQTLTEAHRILSHETHNLALSAADLFRRIERLRSELIDQVSSVRNLSNRIDTLTGADDSADFSRSIGPAEDGGDGIVEDAKVVGSERIEQRVLAAVGANKGLEERVEEVRRKIGKLGGGGGKLSRREEMFGKEVRRLEGMIGGEKGRGSGEGEEGGDGAVTPPVKPGALLRLPNSPGELAEREETPAPPSQPEAEGEGQSLTARMSAVEDLRERLDKEVEDALQRLQSASEDSGGASRSGMASEWKKREMNRVMALMEREEALIEAVVGRLGALGGL